MDGAGASAEPQDNTAYELVSSGVLMERGDYIKLNFKLNLAFWTNGAMEEKHNKTKLFSGHHHSFFRTLSAEQGKLQCKRIFVVSKILNKIASPLSDNEA